MTNLKRRIEDLSPKKRALLMMRLAGMKDGASPVTAEQGIVTGPVPLLPIQRLVLPVLESHGANPNRYSMPFLYELHHALNADIARKAVSSLLLHHDALRLRFHRSQEGWKQFISCPDDDDTVPFAWVDLSALSEGQQKLAIKEAAANLQASLNLSDGPILQIAVFNLGPQRPLHLLVILHHLAADAYSMNILLQDFWTAYQQLDQGTPIRLPNKTTSLKYWSERLEVYSDSEAFQQDLHYWLELPWERAVPLRADYQMDTHNLNNLTMVRSMDVKLTTSETQALLQAQGLPILNGARILDLLLTALVEALGQWTGSRTSVFLLVNHGREAVFDDVNLSRTVGWLTLHPTILLSLEEVGGLGDAVRSITDQLRRIPRNGLACELLRFGGRNTGIDERLRKFPKVHVALDFLGQVRQIPSVFRSPKGPIGSISGLPPTWGSRVLVLTGSVTDDQLHFRWVYNEQVYTPTTVQRLEKNFRETLRALIGMCISMKPDASNIQLAHPGNNPS